MENRSRSLHLSDVIHNMGVELAKSQERPIDHDSLMQFEKGYLWEAALSAGFGEKAAKRIGEVVLDGIHMSPDGVGYDEEGRVVVEEYKCTAMSSETSPADMWKWVMQVKGYCKAVGAVKCIFRVLHIRSFVPVYNVWELVFTQAELDENWASVVAHARTMRGEVADV